MTRSSTGYRFVITLFLITLGLGYVSALTNLYLTHRSADGQPGLTVSDVITQFRGNPSVTRLTSMINGPMRQYLKSDMKKERIEQWVLSGADDAGYLEIRDVFQDRCISCHDEFGKAEFAPLTTFEEVSSFAEPDTGISWNRLARLSHQHFFGMGLIFFALGVILFQSPGRIRLKSWLLVCGYAAIILDVCGWSLTKLSSGFAYLVVVSGMVHAVCFAVIVLICLSDVWGRGTCR
jgi:hypothetical protein